MLTKLADALGVGGSGAIRLLIRQAYEQKFGALPKNKSTRPRRKPKR